MHRSARFALAGSTFCLSTLVGCNGGQGQSSAPVVATVDFSATNPAMVPAWTALSVIPSSISATIVETTVTVPLLDKTPPLTLAMVTDNGADLASSAFANDNFEATSPNAKAAVDFIRALIASNRVRAALLVDDHSLRLVDDWDASLAAMPNARVIGAVVLSLASGRSVVAVSIASPILADGLTSEPIAYLVELSESADGAWLVTGLTFA